MGLREIVKEFEKNSQCNCDLDNWEPEMDTGHSWVCRIDKTSRQKFASLRKPNKQPTNWTYGNYEAKK